MPVYVGATVLFPTLYPAPDATNAPGNPLMAFNDQNAGTQYAYWNYPGNVGTPQAFNATFKYRSILTHGYISGGYKGFNPWRSVNRIWYSTETTLYCGEQLDRAGAYVDGTWSDYNAYVHGTVDSFQGSSKWTSSYSLATGVGRVKAPETAAAITGDNLGQSATVTTAQYELYSPADTLDSGYPTATGSGGLGGWGMSTARSATAACMTGQVSQLGYITGGGSTVTDKLHFPSEIMYNSTASPYSAGQGTSAAGQTYSWVSIGGSHAALNFSTGAWSLSTTSPAFWNPTVCPDGACKILSSKWGYHYGGNGANVTIGYTKFSDVNGTAISTSLSKPWALGEENFSMGQDAGYCLGQYDGQQNNHTWRTNYSNDAIATLGYAAQPKGHVGQSSAACSSAAASICGYI